MATIKRRGKSYLFRVYTGYSVDGKQIERTKTWTPPSNWSEKRAEKEAQHQAALFEESVRNGLEADRKIKFSDFAEQWFTNYAETVLRPRTVARYRDLWARIEPALGYMFLNKIRPVHILDFYSTLNEVSQKAPCRPICNVKEEIRNRDMTKAAFSKATGVSLTTLGTIFQGGTVSRKSAEKVAASLDLPFTACFEPVANDTSLSAATIQKYHHLISKMLHDAVSWQYIPYNPCLRVTPPKAATPEISYLDDAQARHLIELLQSEPGFYRRAISLLLLTGMRRGELMGLEWKDIDLESRTLCIVRTSQYLSGQGVFTDNTKNGYSKRLIVIPSEVVDILIEQRQWQTRQAELLKDAWIQSDRIITMENGRPMRPDRLTHWFSDFIQRTDLPNIHLHSLRHTYATLCIAKKVPITAVAAQMGHANVATTAKIYAHAIQSAQITAADTIDEVFGEIL